jgi:hypothetical protein
VLGFFLCCFFVRCIVCINMANNGQKMARQINVERQIYSHLEYLSF